MIQDLRISGQKQSTRGVPRKRCSENMQQIYRSMVAEGCHSEKNKQTTNKQRKVVCVLEKFCI